MTTALEARDAMLTVFKNAWEVTAGKDISRVRWDDVPGNVPDGETAWARVTIKHATGNQEGFGDTRLFENTGTLWVQIFAPMAEGSDEAYSLAQIVVNAYRDAKNLSVWFRNARMKEVGSSGAFQQINVLTDFTYDDAR